MSGNMIIVYFLANEWFFFTPITLYQAQTDGLNSENCWS
uniref:Uncharacterized protein n=1 Tax=Setaria viridis TaxID=4556 RepID=A0A4U6W304_SETVI|nr:hypothetical protein SEVIR_1G007733v2 [Setaria viridis]